MLKLTPRTTVAEIMAGPPRLYATLKSTGIFRDGDDPDVMLDQLCWNFGLNPSILLMMLEDANVPVIAPSLDITPYQTMDLGELVDHIEHTHHAYLREVLPKLVANTEALASQNAGNQNLAELRDEFRRLATELDGHIHHEEESLFAMVRDLAASTAIRATRCGDSVGGPIACMETEHDTAQRTLAKLRQLSDNYAIPARTTRLWRDTMVELEHFERDLQEHMYKENEALFPRALAAQQGQDQPQPQAATA